MKICLFGDIHGNMAALRAALPAIRQESADLNLCLGDLCGYYFDEDEVIDSVRQLPALVVLRGNHDDMFLRAARGDGLLKGIYRERYGPALDLFLEKPRADLVDWIDALPLSFSEQVAGIAAFHGSPSNPLEEYVYPDTSADVCVLPGSSWIFLGHTHYAMDRSVAGSRIVNPGSLGQPRDGGPARFAVVDTSQGTVQFKNVLFDTRQFVDAVRLRAPDHHYLGDVFTRIADAS